MRIQFHEVAGFVILGMFMLAGIYGQIFDLLNPPEPYSGELSAQSQGIFEENCAVDEKGVESVTITYSSEIDNKASTMNW